MKKLLLLFVTLIAVVSACKDKDKTTPGNVIKYLKKVTAVDAGETKVYQLTYNAQNRLTSFTTEDGSEKRNLVYNDKGLLTKITLEQEGDVDVYEITYSDAGIPTTGSHKIYMEGALARTEAYEYTVVNGKVTVIRAHSQDSETFYRFTYAGANLTKVTTEGDAGGLEISFTFGNKKSPYSAFLLKYAVVPSLAYEIYSPNEMLSMHLKYAQGEFHNNFTYSWGADGFPTGSVMKDPESTPAEDVTSTFEYK